MSNYRDLGLLPNRYQVRRSDGSETESGAQYFVLRYDKDDSWGKACRAALKTLCDEIIDEYPTLAEELEVQITV